MAGSSFSADKAAAPVPVKKEPPPYSRNEAVNTIINPHNQISDEGDILWGACMVCHKNVPEVKEEKAITDVKMRYDDFNQVCLKCHPVKIHPGSEGIGASMSQMVAPDHLTVPSKNILLNIRFILKDIPTILPLDPKSGKVICATCHNPHERGLLIGRADFGADYNLRLRSAGLDICEYCHRK